MSEKIKLAAYNDVIGAFDAASNEMMTAPATVLALFANALFDLSVAADDADEPDRDEFVREFVRVALNEQRDRAEDAA